MKTIKRPRLTEVLVLSTVLFSSLPVAANAQPTQAPLSASLQDVPSPSELLSVRFNNELVSALPFRIRVDDQVSPLAYSLDIRRSPEFGEKWQAISLAGEKLVAVGVRNPLPSIYVARGGKESDSEPNVPTTDIEFAARQIAIWRITNNLTLDNQSVAFEPLLRRAKELADLPNQPDKFVPLQPASYGVDIFVRETTAATVLIALALRTDANSSLQSTQDIDLYLDGVRLSVKTKSRTSIVRTKGGGYHIGSVSELPAGTNEVAEVELDRNTRVIDAQALWINIESDPGLPFISGGSSPPIITAEPAIYTFRNFASLDPDSYTGPRELLDKAGAALLTYLPGPLPWVALIAALYFLPRIGRGIDALFSRAASGYRSRAQRRRNPRDRAASLPAPRRKLPRPARQASTGSTRRRRW